MDLCKMPKGNKKKNKINHKTVEKNHKITAKFECDAFKISFYGLHFRFSFQSIVRQLGTL